MASNGQDGAPARIPASEGIAPFVDPDLAAVFLAESACIPTQQGFESAFTQQGMLVGMPGMLAGMAPHIMLQ